MGAKQAETSTTTTKRKPATAKEQQIKKNNEKEKRENRAKSSANALSKNWLFPLFSSEEKNANKFAADKG